MSVQIHYLLDSASGEGFLPDMAHAIRVARTASDTRALTTLFSLWIDHIEGTLGSKSSVALTRYFRSRVSWMIDGFPILRSSGPPYVAYTMYEMGGSTIVVALAACYQFPKGGEQQWVNTVIASRLARFAQVRVK